MKKELIVTIVCTIGLLLLNCKGNVQKTDTNSVDVKTIDLTALEESLPDSLYFKQLKTVALETTEESLLTQIKRIAIDDNLLFIYDEQAAKIFIFDINGKFIGKIDHKGNGPQEYVETTDFTIDPVKKQIILLCATPEKRMYFTYKGEFIKEENNNNYFSYLTTDGKYLYQERSPGETDYHFYILNTETGEEREILKKIDIKIISMHTELPLTEVKIFYM